MHPHYPYNQQKIPARAQNKQKIADCFLQLY